MKHLIFALFLLLTSALSAQDKMPDEIRNYAKFIIDNGQRLEQEEFSMDTAIVNGKIYNFNPDEYDAADRINVITCNPFSGKQESYISKITPDGSFEIQVPMAVKHQMVYLIFNPKIYSTLVATAGKTVSVYYDMNDKMKPRPGRRTPKLTPYYSGENVDLNYALSNYNFLLANFLDAVIYNDKSVRNILKFSADEYKDHVLENYAKSIQMIDTMSITKRAKELWKLRLLNNVTFMLLDIEGIKGQCYRAIYETPYGEPLPEDRKPVLDAKYFDFIQKFNLNDIQMLYADNFGDHYGRFSRYYKNKFGTKDLNRNELDGVIAQLYYNLAQSDTLTAKEKKTALSIVKKYRTSNQSRTTAEKAFIKKYGHQLNEQFKADMSENRNRDGEAFLNEVLGTGESYFRDFMKLQNYCGEIGERKLVDESAIKEIEQMRFKFYADYVKMRNADNANLIAQEINGGNYFIHKAGESQGDSLLTEMLQDFKGKVVMIDFWATWCVPCRNAIKSMKPMEEEYEGKDVVFLFVADESSDLKVWEEITPSIKGHHYRLTTKQCNTLTDKWGLGTGVPSYVIIGKDGKTKDFHTGFKGVEYYKTIIDKELKK